MTVIIASANAKEGVMLSDRQSTMGWRVANSAEKARSFTSDAYHGVLAGAGHANITAYARQQIQQLTDEQPSLERFVTGLGEEIQDIATQVADEEIAARVRSAKKRSEILGADAEGFLRQELHGIQAQYDAIREEAAGVHMLVMGWDTHNHAVRRWDLNNRMTREFFLNVGMIAGSGSDGAHNYLAEKTLNFEKATMEEMIWETVAAHARSTMNTGVGGTPGVQLVTQQGVRTLNRAQQVCLANIAGIYSAELFPQLVSRQTGPAIVDRVLNEDYNPVRTIADYAGFNLSGFADTYVEPSSWRERLKE